MRESVLIDRETRKPAVSLALMPDDPQKTRYEDLVELAKICAHQARITKAKDVADEFRRMKPFHHYAAARCSMHRETSDDRSSSTTGPPSGRSVWVMPFRHHVMPFCVHSRHLPATNIWRTLQSLGIWRLCNVC
jgi:hypothetical protein